MPIFLSNKNLQATAITFVILCKGPKLPIKLKLMSSSRIFWALCPPEPEGQ